MINIPIARALPSYNLPGKHITMYRYSATPALQNENLKDLITPEIESIYLPDSLIPLVNNKPEDRFDFIEDDNRGAIFPEPFARIDEHEFFLSVKGIGSTTDPFSMKPLTRVHAGSLIGERKTRMKLLSSSSESNRFITGELWLRGSPYGGQGLEHASIAMNATQFAKGTSINGFRIAPILSVNFVPEELEKAVKSIFWYRKYYGRIVQEIRLVPSNIRIYFHSQNTIGGNANQVFNLFSINSPEKAFQFEIHFIRSAIAMLTLFPRTLTRCDNDFYEGLDFYDVWLDKDAVIAPDGTIFFVDLEGIEAIQVRREKVKLKIEEQIFRSLYEFMFAYEQIDQERRKRFGGEENPRIQFEILLREAVKADPFIVLEDDGNALNMLVKNTLNDEDLNMLFSMLDR